MLNPTIARIFRQIAIFQEMMDIPFKPRAHEKAAEMIEDLDEDLADIYKRGGIKGLKEISGIGQALAERIEEYIKHGRIDEYEQLKKQFPINTEELYAVEGIGPKTIKILWQKLKIKNLDDLEKAAKAGKIADIKNLGKKTEENILRGIEFLRQTKNRKTLGNILPLSREIETRFKNLDGVTEAVVAGSVRRRQETIGDIDLLIATTKPKLINEAFIKMPEVINVYAHGKTRSSVRLNNNMDADLRVFSPNEFGAALLYFTGNKQHNIALRKIAISKKLKLNEYGLFKGKKIIAQKTEEEIYNALDMDYIPPEIREDKGEIQAAQKHQLPKLLPYGAIKGDLQMHSNWTDGGVSIEQMALAAANLGYEYIAITDHTKALAMTGGLDEKELEKHGREIDKTNAKLKKIKILKSAELNILNDGSFDINDEALKKLDIVGAAVHTNFKMSRADMTKRICVALKNPYLNILFHPTGRIINKRPAYDVDMDEVIKTAKKYNVVLEIDAFPDRLDLKDEHARKAIETGVKLAIDTDAHSPEHLKFMEYGEATARRAWARESDIINTMPLDELLAFLKRKRSKL